MALGPEIEQYIDLFEQLLDNLRASAAKGVEMPLEQLIGSFLPDDHECHCTMLSVTLGLAVQKLVLTGSSNVH